jgi:hypothetical protein
MVSRRRIFLLALFLGCFLGALIYRYRNSLNYGQVHVKLPAEFASRDDISVAVKSKFGALGELVQSTDDPLIWGMRETVPSVVSLVLAADQRFEFRVNELTARLGEHWVSPFNDISPAGEAAELPEFSVPRKAFAIEVPLSPVHRSAIPSQSTVVNWQGDLWLFLVPFLQSCLVVAVGLISVRLWSVLATEELAANAATSPMLRHSSKLLDVVGATLRVMFLILVAHQLRSVCYPLWNVRWGYQFLWASLIFVALVVLTWRYTRAICTSLSYRHQFKLLLGLLALAGIAKVIWVASFDSAQTADFRDYWRHGQSMAKGDWRSVSDPDYALLPVIAKRSYVFVLPLVKLFDASLTSMELINIVLQLLTVAMCVWLVQRMYDFKTACLAVPFLLIYPDFWYSPTVCTHDTPGYFWVVAFFCIFELVRIQVIRFSKEKLTGYRCICMGLLSVAMGVSFAMVELQRSFGPFLLLGIVLYFGVTLILIGQKIWLADWLRWMPTCVGILGMSFIAFTTAGGIQRSITQELVSKVGPFKPTTTLAYLTAVDSTTDATWTNMHPWRFWYYPEVPESHKQELTIRKLVHEKLISGPKFWLCLLRKNQGLSNSTFMMEEAFGGSSSAGFNDALRVPWYSFNRFLCNACYAATLCLFVIRLIYIGRFPVTSAELYPLCYCVGQYLTILFTTELAFTYDQFTAFPLAWSSALVLRALTEDSDWSPRNILPGSSTLIGSRWIGVGIAGIAIVILGQCGLGVVCSQFGYGFIRPIPVDKSVREGVTDGISSFSDVHCVLRSPPNQKQFKKDEVFQAAYKLPVPHSERRRLAFFVSANQRAEAAGENVSWEKIPATYAIRIGGKEVVSGPVEDLSNIQFVTAEVNKDLDILLEMELKYHSDYQPSSVKLRPAMAVEYMHWPRSSSRESTSVLSSGKKND